MGYVTRGKGVAVHSRMCPNVQNLMYDVERKIEVEWARTAEDAFPVRIVVHTDDRPGMLNQLTSLLSDENTNIRSLEAKAETGPGRRRGGNDRGRARQEAAREAGVRHAAHLRRARRGTALQLNMSLATDPEHIAISKSKGIKIDWKDGHRSEYGLDVSARQVPLRGLHGRARHAAAPPEAGRNPFQMYQAGAEDAGRGAGGKLRHPHRLERRPQRPASILSSISGAFAPARSAGRCSGIRRAGLQEPEIHFDGSGHCDGLAVLGSGFELPELDGFHGLLIQAQAEAAHHAHICRLATGIDLDVQHHGSLVLGLAGFFGVLRLLLKEQDRGRDAATNAEYAASETAALTGSKAAALAGANSAAGDPSRCRRPNRDRSKAGRFWPAGRRNWAYSRWAG